MIRTLKRYALNTPTLCHCFCGFIFSLAIAVTALNTHASNIKLPDLGSVGGGIISPAQEYQLGQRWLRMYRSQVRTTSDPFILSYVEQLVRKLAKHSELDDKRLDILVTENASLNAFAVPGGVMGIHTGLFTYAQNEEQFSSVIAHELGHLSQRHYARSLEEQRDNSIPNMAALLASILIAATAGGDAGLAAIATTQALAIDQQLRFSRQMEQEADRIGMMTMVNAKLDPYAMSEMFEQMLKTYRFRSRPPEFLLTHPLTESRVSDARLRAQPFPRQTSIESQEYQLLQIRVAILHESNTQFLVNTYSNYLKDKQGDEDLNRYGLALSYLKLNEYKKAEETLAPSLEKNKDNLYFAAAMAKIKAEQGNFREAIALITTPLKKTPDHNALNIQLAEIYIKGQYYKEAEQLLEKHAIRRPKDDYVWYLLAEVHGLTGKILQVHMSRTEYFLLNGLYDKAENQIRNGLRLTKNNDREKLVLEQKLKRVRKLKRETL